MSIDFAAIFEFLYPIVPIIAIIGFCPQLIAAIKSKTRLESVSLTTWLIWLVSWGVALGYSAVTIADPMLTFTASVNILFHIVLIGTIIFKRYHYRNSKDLGAVLEVNPRVNPDIRQVAHQMHDQGYQRIKIERTQNDGVVTVDDALIPQQAQTIQ